MNIRLAYVPREEPFRGFCVDESIPVDALPRIGEYAFSMDKYGARCLAIRGACRLSAVSRHGQGKRRRDSHVLHARWFHFL